MSAPIHFAPSPYAPLAMSFFGLALGYLIVGGQKLSNYPASTPDTERAVGIWSLYGPGVVQSASAIILLVGLTWFGVFESKPVTYALALAFLAMAAHWIAMGVTRIRGANTDLEAWMGLPMLALAILVAWVVFAAGEVPIGIAFVLLALVYIADSLRATRAIPAAPRLQGAVQVLAALWMTYLTFAIALTFTGTLHAWM